MFVVYIYYLLLCVITYCLEMSNSLTDTNCLFVWKEQLMPCPCMKWNTLFKLCSTCVPYVNVFIQLFLRKCQHRNKCWLGVMFSVLFQCELFSPHKKCEWLSVLIVFQDCSWLHRSNFGQYTNMKENLISPFELNSKNCLSCQVFTAKILYIKKGRYFFLGTLHKPGSQVK